MSIRWKQLDASTGCLFPCERQKPSPKKNCVYSVQACLLWPNSTEQNSVIACNTSEASRKRARSLRNANKISRRYFKSTSDFGAQSNLEMRVVTRTPRLFGQQRCSQSANSSLTRRLLYPRSFDCVIRALDTRFAVL